MSQNEYAKHRGCSQPYVSSLVKRGRIPTVNGKIDPVTADAALAETQKGGQPASEAVRERAREARKRSLERRAQEKGAAAAPAGGNGHGRLRDDPTPARTATASFTEARAKRETFLAMQAEIDYGRSVGELVEMATVRRAISDCGVATRRLVEQIPNRIAANMAAALGVDVRRVQPMMEREIQRVCDEIADTAQALPETLGLTRQ